MTLQRTSSGQVFQTIDNKPPISGSTVTTWKDGQQVKGIYNGGSIYTK